jgi:hypothetical protein
MGRIVAQIIGVICIGGGVGLLTWGISSGPLGEKVAAEGYLWGILPSASAVIGLGAALLTVGIATIVLTFLGRNRYGSWDE